MRALHFDGTALRCTDAHPEPRPGPGEAIVRVRLAGICSTDLQILAGYMGFTGVPGHEFVGEVVDGPAELAGQRVVGEINFACGRCPTCGRGLGRHCPERRVMGILGADGAFAEYLAVPVANLHAVPDGVPDEAAAFTEPLAAAFSILEQVPLGPADDVVVLGDGKLGLLCAQVLAGTGAAVMLVGKHAANLALVADRGVATALLDAWAPGGGAGCVVDATGSVGGLALAMAAVRPRGRLVLKSTVADRHELSLAPLVINEVTVVGSRCGPFPPAVRALTDGTVAVTPLIDSTFPLTAGVEALAHAARPGVRKVLLAAV
ncbi:MAG TPA: alcohol dehydrogenase catalytic domain-containing protein [Acidimicrobiia bacterium]|nr:alcohol dehydrogenase catalytic domain-containing protein [Acidimicrobiia bacterium]